MFDCSNVRLFPPRFEDDLAIVDLVIRVVILFNFQLPVFKDQASTFRANGCVVYHFLLDVRKGENEENYIHTKTNKTNRITAIYHQRTATKTDLIQHAPLIVSTEIAVLMIIQTSIHGDQLRT